MNAYIERAQLLMGQERYEPAQEQLAKAIAEDPNAAQPHALLAICLQELKKDAEALQEARYAVHLEPDHPLTHYVLARIHLEADRFDEALHSTRQALRLDPEEPDFHAQMAAIHAGRRGWKEALESAEHGLALDAEHVGCANLRAMALTQLGRRDEAGLAMRTTLSRQPDNAISHANMGWTLLHQNRPRDAMHHFQESLRLDPNNEWARLGIVEALKAHNIVYRQLLRYFLWMSRLNPGVQIALIVGAYVLMRVLRRVSQQFPQLQPYLTPVFIAYLAFVFLAWTAEPLFNLLLRVHPLGRHALSRDQVRASNFVGLLVILGSALIAASFFVEGRPLLGAGALSLALIIPVAATFRASPGKARTFFAVYTSILLLLLVVALLAPAPFSLAALGFGFLGVIAFTWIANVVLMAS